MSHIWRRRKLGAGAILLALTLGVLAWASSERLRRVYSPTHDEPTHTRAARELRDGPGVVSNFEHPLLAKLLAALPLGPPDPTDQWKEIRAARRPFPIAYGLLVAMATAWAIRRLGPVAGAAFGVLLLAEPSLRGHAVFVHTDILLTTLLGATVILQDLASRAKGQRWLLLAAAGAVYGLALATKHSALVFLPVVAATAALTAVVGASRPPWREVLRRLSRGAVSFVVPAIAVFLAVQISGGSWTSRESFAAVARTTYGKVADAETIDAIATRLPVGLSSYVVGVLQVRVSAGRGSRYHYLLGQASGTGWLLYFPVALALKLTTATVLLVVLGLALGVTIGRGASRSRSSRLRRILGSRAWLPIVVGGGYLALACASRLNIGVRHALPAVPLLLFAAIAAVRTRFFSRPTLRVVILTVAVAGALLEAATHLDREISFGNVLAGGSTGVRRALSDSNTDWGQRQDLVYSRTARGDLGRVGILSISFDMDRARKQGLSPVPLGDDAILDRLDSVFVSVYVVDHLHVMETNRESYPHFQAVRRNLCPWMRRIASRAKTTELVGDEYVLYRFR